MHLTYLDSTYDMKVLNQWKKMQYEGSEIWQGHSLYDYIGSHLGYRLTVKCVKMKITWFGKAEFIIEIENTGFGRLFQEAELFLTIENEKTGKSPGFHRFAGNISGNDCPGKGSDGTCFGQSVSESAKKKRRAEYPLCQ